MGVYLRAKFQVYCIFRTSFRKGVIPPPLSPTQDEPLKSPPRLGIMMLAYNFTEYFMEFFMEYYTRTRLGDSFCDMQYLGVTSSSFSE